MPELASSSSSGPARDYCVVIEMQLDAAIGANGANHYEDHYSRMSIAGLKLYLVYADFLVG
jgi:hypothetical protein